MWKYLVEVPELLLHVDSQFWRQHIYQGSSRQLSHRLTLLVSSGQIIEHLVGQLIDFVDYLNRLSYLKGAIIECYTDTHSW